MMDRKGVSIKQSMFAIVAFSTLIIAVGVMMGGLNEGYDSGIDYDLTEYDQLDEASDTAQSQRSSVTPKDVDTGTADFEGGLFRGGYGILGSVFASFGGVFGMLESIENRWGIPSYVGQAIITFIFLALIFAILAVIFRLSREP